MDPGVLAVMIPIIALCIPFWAIYWQRYNERLKFDDKREARRSLERLTIEKLEVIKTAISMGYSDEELGILDKRLEQLVGSDVMRGLQNPDKSAVALSHDLLDTDIDREVERLEKARRKRSEN